MRFTSILTNGKVLEDYNYTNVSGIPKLPTSVIMNLWLMAPPSNGKSIEFINSDFKITGYSTRKLA